jgi:hypothetical protein
MPAFAQEVQVRCPYWVFGRFKSRDKAWFNVSTLVPVRLRVAETVSPVVARMTRRTSVNNETFEWRVVDGALMRAVLAPEKRTFLSLERLAELADTVTRWCDHPAGEVLVQEWGRRPYPFVNYEKDEEEKLRKQRKPYNMVERDAVPLRAIEHDGRAAAETHFREAATGLRVVDGVVFMPAVPPAWGVKVRNGHARVTASAPDFDIPELRQPGFDLLDGLFHDGAYMAETIPSVYVDCRVPSEVLAERIGREDSEVEVNNYGDKIEIFDAAALPENALDDANLRVVDAILRFDVAKLAFGDLPPGHLVPIARLTRLLHDYRRGRVEAAPAARETKAILEEIHGLPTDPAGIDWARRPDTRDPREIPSRLRAVAVVHAAAAAATAEYEATLVDFAAMAP